MPSISFSLGSEAQQKAQMLTLIARTRKLSSSKLRLLIQFSLQSQSTTSYPLLASHCQILSIATSSIQATFFSSLSGVSSQGKPSLSLTREGNYDDSTLKHVVCPGCGVGMQELNPKLPGFFSAPIQKSPNYRLFKSHLEPISQEPEFSNSLKRGVIAEPENLNPPAPNLIEKPVVCARCHSLRHYGKVKDSTIENLLPDFDFDHTVGRKLVSVSGTRSVVLLVVDASDFDGSFPKKVARLVSDTFEENSTAWKKGQSGNVPRIVLVVTKIDLLPSKISPTGFEHWVRRRARENGVVKVTSLHLVSAVRDWGLKNLVDDVVSLAGPRGNVWAVGAQNAGKSTLINAIGKLVGGGEKVTHLTEAPVPGTTLGILRVEGILPGKAKLFDTPGLLNPHQITTRLTREEQRLVYVSKELKPRTYRIKVSLCAATLSFLFLFFLL